MANIQQIYQIVNDTASQALGSSAVTVVDTASFVSLGQQVFTSNENVDMFWKALTDRIGRTVYAIRKYEAKRRAVHKDEMIYGIIMQKVSYTLSKAVEDPSYFTDKQQSPFDIEKTITVQQKLFSANGTWSHEEVIPTYQQLRTAFTNESTMAGFISGLMMAIENALELDIENLDNLAVSTAIAGIIQDGNPSLSINLLSEYNTKYGTSLTVANCMTNLDWLKYASMRIGMTLQRMSRYSTLFNVGKTQKHTPQDLAVVEILTDFAKSADYYLQSDTYHEVYTALPNYEEVSYWQGSGTSYAFEDVSRVAIENGEGISVNQTGVIAFIHDIDMVSSSFYDRRSYSVFNPRSEVMNYMEKATKGYAVDLNENGVVFYIADPVSVDETTSVKKASVKKV